jgi:PilZ domain
MDQRKHKRVPISAVATVTFMDAEGFHSVQAMAGSISFGGIGLYSDDPLTDGTDVSIAVNFISAEGSMQRAVVAGHVVYSKMIGELYYEGIQFDEEINRKNQPFLYEHIAKVLKWDNA